MNSSRFEFTGSMVGGMDSIDLIAESGLMLTAAEEGLLWEKTTERELLADCPCVEECVVDRFDGSPGQSDVFYTYAATSREQLRLELQSAIHRVLLERR